jgi:hypothetical protein
LGGAQNLAGVLETSIAQNQDLGVPPSQLQFNEPPSTRLHKVVTIDKPDPPTLGRLQTQIPGNALTAILGKKVETTLRSIGKIWCLANGVKTVVWIPITHKDNFHCNRKLKYRPNAGGKIRFYPEDRDDDRELWRISTLS